MRIQKLPSADSAMLTVSTTARTIEQFIALADSPTSDDFEFFDGANFVELFVESGDIRYMLDGNTPTASLGTPAPEGSSITLMAVDLSKVKLIREGDSDATVVVVRSGEVKEGELQASTPVSAAGGTSDNPVFVSEVNRPGGEDNANNVFATANKPSKGTVYAWNYYQSQALEASKVVLAVAGKVKKITALIDTGAAADEYFLHVLDATAVPIDGHVTLLCPPRSVQHVLNTQSKIEIDISDPGINFASGLVVYISTSQVAKAIAGNVALFGVEYK